MMLLLCSFLLSFSLPLALTLRFYNFASEVREKKAERPGVIHFVSIFTVLVNFKGGFSSK